MSSPARLLSPYSNISNVLTSGSQCRKHAPTVEKQEECQNNVFDNPGEPATFDNLVSYGMDLQSLEVPIDCQRHRQAGAGSYWGVEMVCSPNILVRLVRKGLLIIATSRW
jgi:hypothetical protein